MPAARSGRWRLVGATALIAPTAVALGVVIGRRASGTGKAIDIFGNDTMTLVPVTVG